MRLLRELGRGAFGVVHEAEVAGERVAFKALLAPDDRARRKFVEVRSIAHANLVRLHDWVDGRGFTMELVPGADLVTHVRGAPALEFEGGRPNLPVAFGQRLQPEGTSAYVTCDEAGASRLRVALRQLLAGLRCLHSAGFVHGDVRPSNVLVTAEGRLVVVDFGLSRAQGDGSPYEASAAYAPPELTPSPAADLYAAGTLAFECLTGQLPFLGSAQHVMVTKATLPPPRPSFLVRGVPDDLDDLTIGLLSRLPEKRFVAVDTFA